MAPGVGPVLRLSPRKMGKGVSEAWEIFPA